MASHSEAGCQKCKNGALLITIQIQIHCSDHEYYTVKKRLGLSETKNEYSIYALMIAFIIN